jgi:hypothetical protein
MSTQRPPHSTRFVPQLHTPFEQSCPASQARSQRPQCNVFESRSTQLDPQRSTPGKQFEPQLPFEHTLPAAQALPQRPQLRASLARSTHPPAHALKLPSQRHAPFTQSCPVPQALPHWPQLSRSLETATHSPQSRIPSAHCVSPSSSGELPQLIKARERASAPPHQEEAFGAARRAFCLTFESIS